MACAGIAYNALLYNAVGPPPYSPATSVRLLAPLPPLPPGLHLTSSANLPVPSANFGAAANRTNVELQAVVAALASGPVGISDGPGLTNATRCLMFCTKDGTLLHPTVAATPIDKMFHSTLRPDGDSAKVRAAPTLVGGNGGPGAVWWTVLAVDLARPFLLDREDLNHFTPDGPAPNTVPPPPPLLAWRLHDPACSTGKPASGCLRPLASGSGGGLHLETGGASLRAFSEHRFSNFGLGLVCEDGFGLLGELGKHVAASAARLASVRCLAGDGEGEAAGGVEVQVAGAAGEQVRH